MSQTDPYNEALDKFLRDSVGTITDGQQTVTRWALIYEISDGDGRMVQMISSDNALLHDIAGMLTWATQIVQRGITRCLDAIDPS